MEWNQMATSKTIIIYIDDDIYKCCINFSDKIKSCCCCVYRNVFIVVSIVIFNNEEILILSVRVVADSSLGGHLTLPSYTIYLIHYKYTEVYIFLWIRFRSSTSVLLRIYCNTKWYESLKIQIVFFGISWATHKQIIHFLFRAVMQ